MGKESFFDPGPRHVGAPPDGRLKCAIKLHSKEKLECNGRIEGEDHECQINPPLSDKGDSPNVKVFEVRPPCANPNHINNLPKHPSRARPYCGLRGAVAGAWDGP